MKKLKKIFSIQFCDSNSKEVIENSLIAFTIKILAIALSYIFTIIVSRFYGAQILGLFNIAILTLSVSGILATLGFDQTILRLSAQLIHDKKSIYEIYKKMLRVSLSMSILLLILIAFFSDKLSEILTKTTLNKQVFLMISFTVPFFSLSTINIEAIRGLKFIKESEFFRMLCGNIISLISFLLLVYMFSFKEYFPVLSFIIGVIFTSLFSLFFILDKIKFEKDKKVNNDFITTKKILDISLPMLTITLLNILSNFIPSILLAYFKTSKDVGIFNVAFKIATLTSFILVSINSIVAPKFAELYWNNKIEDLKKTIKIASKLNFWTSTPLLVLFMLFPKFFMTIFGEEFKEGHLALVILSFGQFINAFSGSVGYFLTMTGKQKFFSSIFFISTIITGLLCFLLIPNFGINGAAISFTIGMIFWNITALVYIRIKYLIDTYYLPFIT